MTLQVIFFDTWMSLLRTFIIGVMAYTAMIFLLRVSGKRTLSKMNAFDFIVTVALGSTLAAVIVNKEIALVDGVLGFAILIFLQHLITWTSYRSKRFTKLIKSEPSILYYKGKYLTKTMEQERVTKEEIIASIRQHGNPDMNSIEAIVLETDGSLSIIQPPEQDGGALKELVKNQCKPKS
ncbi:MAG: DUF421 domain-containing protein [Cytophagaceae bacterium]